MFLDIPSPVKVELDQNPGHADDLGQFPAIPYRDTRLLSRRPMLGYCRARPLDNSDKLLKAIDNM
jgi:hypothetical protein